MNNALRQYNILKIETDVFYGDNQICTSLTLNQQGNRKIYFNVAGTDINLFPVAMQQNQLTHVIKDYYFGLGIQAREIDWTHIIVEIHANNGKKHKEIYAYLAQNGFTLKFGDESVGFVRFAAGAGQIRRNTVTFIRADVYDYIFSKLMNGLSLDDFGDDFVINKFSAYFALSLSGCHLLPQKMAPRVCIVDDFEAIKPNDICNYVTEEEVYYITDANGDNILGAVDGIKTETDLFSVNLKDKKVIRKSDGEIFKLRKGYHKTIERIPYNDIPLVDPLNSFDGQGLVCPEWVDMVRPYIGAEDYMPSELIIRAPFIKGMVANVDFRLWFKTKGIEEITDSFGGIRKVDEIDILMSKSQFKVWKVYEKKALSLGVNPWDYYTDCLHANGLRWGIVKPNNRKDDDYKATNYQCLQALDITESEALTLCKTTDDYLKLISSDDIESVFKALSGKSPLFEDDDTDETEDNNYQGHKIFEVVLNANKDFLQDAAIRKMILDEVKVKFDQAKIGKIFLRGGYQFMVSDPVAQMEWIARNHAGLDIDVVGVVPAGCVYANYWMEQPDNTKDGDGKITISLMRSPFIDRNEGANRLLLEKQIEEFRYLKSGIVLSIHDLTALGAGGADFDGDIIFSTNNPIVRKGLLEYGEARPLKYADSGKKRTGALTKENMIETDILGFFSKVGQISNISTSLYAKLASYKKGTEEYQKIYDMIIGIGQNVGTEIDKIKTGLAPNKPIEWTILQNQKTENDVDTESGQRIIRDNTLSEESKGMFLHNMFAPAQKPYYFRYIYDYLHKNATGITMSYKHCAYVMFGLKWSEFLDAICSGNATDDMISLYKQFTEIYPLDMSNCVVNIICHHFEQLEKEVKTEARKTGTNLLYGYCKTSQSEIKKDIKETVHFYYERYSRQMRDAVKGFQFDEDNKKEIIANASSVYQNIRMLFLEQLIQLCGDLQTAFDYMVSIDVPEETIFKVLGERIIEIIGGSEQ